MKKYLIDASIIGGSLCDFRDRFCFSDCILKIQFFSKFLLTFAVVNVKIYLEIRKSLISIIKKVVI